MDEFKYSGDELIFDIETTSLNTATAKLKYCGFYSYKYNKFFFYTYKQLDEIIKLFTEHRVLIGHNIKEYDIKVLKNNINNFTCLDYKVLVDTLKVAKTRLNTMYDSNNKKITAVRFSLDKVHKVIFPGEEGKKLNFNIKLMQKEIEELSIEELKLIEEYTMQDIKITKNIFEAMVEQNKHLKPFMNSKEQRNYKWLTMTYGSYAYHVFCARAKLNEEYVEGDTQTYEGGFVIEPRCKELHNDIYLLDFVSMYPHNFFQFNLFSPCVECGECGGKNIFFGNTLFKVNSKYCTKIFGKYEKILKDLFLERLEYKKNKDPRADALKVVILSMYGITAKPTFKNVYYKNRAADCCLLGRQQIQYADYYFSKIGYTVVYGDTDSLFLKDNFKNYNKLKNHVNAFKNILKSYMPFPSDTFDFAIEKEKINDLYLFEKKKYMYILESGRIIYKNVDGMKADSTHLSKELFKRYIENELKTTRTLKIPLSKILNWCKIIIAENPNIIGKEFNIDDDITHYKNKTSIQYQIFKRYGSGNHILIPNTKYGIGKSTKYCSINEAAKLNVFDLDLSTTLSELKHFIYDDLNKNLLNYI